MENNNLQEIVKKVIDSMSFSDINLEKARYIIQRVEEKASEMGVKAVVAVANAGANIVAVECMDESYIASYDIAVNKAYTSVSLKMDTSLLKTMAQPEKELYGIQFTNGGRIVIFGGGVALKNREGKVMGGVGVSGGSEAEDTALGDFAKKVFSEEIL